MKREKKFEKVRHFGMLCIMIVMVLGMMSVPRTVTCAAEPEDLNAEPDGLYYRIQWPVDNPQGYCNIHFVKENGDPLDPGEHNIDCVSGNNINNIKGNHDLKNVKCIWGSDEQLRDIRNDEESLYTGWYLNLLDLVSPPQPKVPEDQGDQEALAEYGKEYALYEKFHNLKFEDYEFVRAYVGDENGFNQKEENVINPYLYGINDDKDGNVIKMRYYKEYDPSWEGEKLNDDAYGVPADGKDIYLVFKEKADPKQVEDTNTISNAKIGLNVYLFDYPRRMWGDHDYTESNPDIGLYSTVLGESGFPVFNDGKNDATDMSEYFKPGNDNEYYIGTADNLFQYDLNRKIYYYNSARNAAYYNKAEGKFVLYDEVVCPEDYTHKGWFFRRGAFQRGNFLPFNDIDKDKIWAFNVDEGEQRATPVYGLDGAPDYHFGMFITGNIYQPKDGKVNNEDMIFNITGDDDILVYIDDVLVLDLGGIHDPVKGTINFNTGAVTVNGAGTSSLYDLLKGHVDGSKLDEDGETLADNSLHTIKVFYAERGEGASNLWVELNAPDPSITIKNNFLLDENGYYYSLDKEKLNIGKVEYILEDEEGKERRTITAADFTDGTYTFENLDYTKKYVVTQKLYDTNGNLVNGSTGDYSYERKYLNDLNGDSIENKSRDEDTGEMKTSLISLYDGKSLSYPTIEFNNVYKPAVTGSIVIDNSFILKKTDGTTTPLDNAPNKEAFDKVVFIVRNEDNNIVAEVKYSEFSGGKYTVGNLDVNSDYTIEVTGVDDKTGTEERSYEKTTIDKPKVKPSEIGTPVSVVNQYKEVDSSKEITNKPETGSIIIDNSFILNKTDGTTQSLDNAPNKEAFKNVVFKVKDEDGKVVAEVPYSKFKDGKYTVDGLDVNKKYTIEITGIDDKTGTKERPYVTTTIDATVVTPSKDGTTVLVVNKYKEVDSSKKNSNKDKTNNTTNNTTTSTSQAAGTSAVPKTGDNMNILLYVLLLLGAAGGMTGCIVMKKKIQKQGL